MDVISLFVVLVIVGVFVYLINTLVPTPAWMKTLIHALAGLFVFLYLLQFFGLWNGFHVHLR